MKGRRVRDNHGTETPAMHIAIDTETTAAEPADAPVRRHRLLLGRAIYWSREGTKIKARQTFGWTDNADFWLWLEARLSWQRPTWVWCHNLGFDANICGLFDQLDNGNLVMRFKAFSSDLCLIIGTYKGRSIRFVDTYHWTGRSVAKMGEWLGIPKLPRPPEDALAEVMGGYCLRDAEVVEGAVNAICDMVRHLDLGVMKMTAGMQALQHWWHLPGRGDVYIPSRPAEAELARASFYGGRYWAPYIGVQRQPIWELDVNGAYGHAMATEQLPIRHISTGQPPPGVDLWKKWDPIQCCAAVTIETDHPSPVWTDAEGLLWATGTFRTTLAGPELLDAVRHGRVRRVHKMSIYELGTPCKAFANYWWARRQEFKAAGHTFWEEFSKLMPPRLFGKLAQLAPQWTDAGTTGTDQRWGALEFQDPHTLLIHPGRVIAGQWEYDAGKALKRSPVSGAYLPVHGTRALPREETEHSFVAISAWITSYIRLLMDAFRDIAGTWQTLYQACDALHVTQQGYDALADAGCVDPTCRGALKVKNPGGKPYQEVHYHGVNLLRIDGKLKAAGLPGLHEETSYGVCQTTLFEKLDSILMRGPDGRVEIARKEWRLSETPFGDFARDSGWQDHPRLPR